MASCLPRGLLFDGLLVEEDEDENGSSLDLNSCDGASRGFRVRLARAAGRSKKYPTVARTLNRATETGGDAESCGSDDDG